MKLRNICKIGAVCIGILGFTGCGSTNMSLLSQAGQVAMQGLMITNDDLITAVSKSVVEMDAQNQVAPTNNKYTQRLNNLTRGLDSTGKVALNFKVYITNEINAFACPDGSVRVYSGIMDLMDDEELLGIIGHEVGHVAMEHSLNAYKQQYMNQAALLAIGSTNTTLASLTNSQLGELLNAAISAKYSRSQENQADDFGYEFLKGAGYNPWAMVKAFEKMQALESSSNTSGQLGTNMTNMFSSHPETSERIKRMTEHCVADGYTRE